MSQNPGAKLSPLPALASDGGAKDLEASVRQLIANGNSKLAVENAKQLHKAQRSPLTENLLLDAYRARIQALIDQNLASDAKALVELVQERFPNARLLLNDIGVVASARAGDLAALLQPLNDPALSTERRAAIEQIVQTQVTDLQSLADCVALAPDHSLRQASAALQQAFIAVTSGPVTDEQIALPEVSHRSPLAPWKLLIRAIACLYRNQDRQCSDYLAAIKPDSGPGRLVPAVRAMLGGGASSLKPAAQALLSQTRINLTELHSALQVLDRSFAEDDENRIFKSVRSALSECKRSAPERVDKLKQIIFVRAAAARLDSARVSAALDGSLRKDANLHRMYALALEISNEPGDLAEACQAWELFREQALREKWFPPQGVEMGELYLHMARVASRIPRKTLAELQKSGGLGYEFSRGQDLYFLHPEILYQRACVMDPHAEPFSQWLDWASGQSVAEGESVAREWHRLCPRDIDPLLYLMTQAEKRNAYPSALAFLEKAESVDAVHSLVRAARLRILTAGALRHLRQKKPHLVLQDIAMIEALPQSQQGDRPAFLASLRSLVHESAGDRAATLEAFKKSESLLGDSLAAIMLAFGIAATARRTELGFIPSPKALKPEKHRSIPSSLARVWSIAKDFGIKQFAFPEAYFPEAEKQFPFVSDSLDVEHLRSLAQLGESAEYPKLVWLASASGLKRGGPMEAFFLLARARALPPQNDERRTVLAAAAAELARFHRDNKLVDESIEILRDSFGGESLTLTLGEAREVVQREIASPKFPNRYDNGPNYDDLLHRKLCQCRNCRRDRGEAVEPEPLDNRVTDRFDMDESEMQRIFDDNLPDNIPPELAKILFNVMKESFLSGESPDDFMDEIFPPTVGVKKSNKGKRKK